MASPRSYSVGCRRRRACGEPGIIRVYVRAKMAVRLVNVWCQTSRISYAHAPNSRAELKNISETCRLLVQTPCSHSSVTEETSCVSGSTSTLVAPHRHVRATGGRIACTQGACRHSAAARVRPRESTISGERCADMSLETHRLISGGTVGLREEDDYIIARILPQTR